MGDMSSLEALTTQADKEEDEIQSELHTNSSGNSSMNSSTNRSNQTIVAKKTVGDPNQFMMRRFVFKNGKFLPRCGKALFSDDEGGLHIIMIRCEEDNRICSEGACICKPHTIADLWASGKECGRISDGCDAEIELPACKPGQTCRNHKCLCHLDFPGGTLPPDPHATTTPPPPYHICPHHLDFSHGHDPCPQYCQDTGYTGGVKIAGVHEEQCQCEEALTLSSAQCPAEGPNQAPLLNQDDTSSDGKKYCYYTPCSYVDDVHHTHSSALLEGSSSEGNMGVVHPEGEYVADQHECGFVLDACGVEQWFGLRGGGCPEGFVCEQNTFACVETHALQSSLLELDMAGSPSVRHGARNVSFARHIGIASNAEITSMTSSLMRRAGGKKKNSIQSLVPPGDHAAPLRPLNPMYHPNSGLSDNSPVTYSSHDDGHGSSHSSGHDDTHSSGHDDGHGSTHSSGHDDTHSSSGHDDGHGSTHSSGHDDTHSSSGHDDGHGSSHGSAHEDAEHSTTPTPDPHSPSTTPQPVINASEYDDNAVNHDQSTESTHLVPKPLSCHAGQMETYFYRSEEINDTHIRDDGRCINMKDIARGLDFEDDPVEVGYSRRRRAEYWALQSEGEVGFARGTYIFSATYKAGIRVYLDNELILDGWKHQHSRVGTSGAPVEIKHGDDQIAVKKLQIQYKALAADSFMKVDWEKVNILKLPFSDKCLTCKGLECMGGLRLTAISDPHYCKTSFTLDHAGKLRCDQAPHMCLHHMIGGHGVEPLVPYGLWGCASSDDEIVNRGQTWTKEHVAADHETKYKLKYNPAVYLVNKDV
jgi:hypothetical protein